MPTPTHGVPKSNMSPCRHSLVALVALFLHFLLLGAASGDLVAVYSIARHGARNVLPKSANLSETDQSGGPALIPAGQQQCYDAGRIAMHVTHVQYTCRGSNAAPRLKIFYFELQRGRDTARPRYHQKVIYPGDMLWE